MTIEITESNLSLNPVNLRTHLNTFCGLGVNITNDNFGKDYYFPLRLTHMLLDKLKIEASFVSGDRGRTQKDILDLMMTLSYKLSLSIFAEDVET